MQECEQFTGRLRTLCDGTADRPLSTINKYRAMLGLSPLPVAQHRPGTARPRIHATVKSTVPPKRHRLDGWGPGSQLIKIFSAKGMPACQACYALAEKMDVWGVDGCREHFDEIVMDILPRAKQWLKSNHGWARRLFVIEAVEDMALKTAIGYQVNHAIKAAEKPRPKTVKRQAQKSEPVVKFSPKQPRTAESNALAETLLADTEVIVKSFMRQDSLLRFVQSVRHFYPVIPIRVADDSPTLTEAGRKVQQTPGVAWHQMPFDQGLPAGRNLCMRKSLAKYVIVCDDDFAFTADTDLAALLLPLTADVDLCGGLVRMNGTIAQNWCGTLSITGGKIVMLTHHPKEEKIEGVRVFRSDVTYNFFAARRDVLLKHPWDERYKITSEHLDSFLTWKQAGVRVAYTIDCLCSHLHGGDAAYKTKRRRNQSGDLLKKWHATNRSTVSVTKFMGL